MKQAKRPTVTPLERAVTTTLETIDPAAAKAMLDSSPGNRSISQSRVDAFVIAMCDGEWKGWAAPIQINTQGQLINGHHRLHAVILANRAVQQCVARNVPDDTIEAIDLGRSRTLSDVLSMPTKHYVPNGTAVAALVNGLHLLLEGQRLPIGPATVTRYRAALGEDCFAKGLRWYDRVKKGRLPTPSAVGAALTFVYRTDGSDKSLRFCEQVSECVGAAGDPAHTVARYLTTHGRGVTHFEVLSRIAGAHLSALAGRPLVRSARADEAANQYRERALETWGGIALGLNK